MISVQASHNQLDRRKPWLCVLLLCFIVRAAIPTGFMPGTPTAGDAFSWITLCYGNAGSAQLLSLSQPNHAVHHSDHHSDHLQSTQHQPHQAHPQASHSWCAFAANLLHCPAAIANLLPDLQLKSITPPASHTPVLTRHIFRPQSPRAPPFSAFA